MMLTKILKSRYFWLFFIFVIFLLARIWGLDLPYHQDENTWSDYAGSGVKGLSGIPHPPLSGLIFISAFQILGSAHLRYLPFVVGIINFWLIFLLVRYRFSRSAALWSALFFSVGFYGVLASLMVDTDGQILPLFFLLSAISFYKWRDSETTRRKIIWGSLLVISILLGFLTKASFIITAGAIVFELLYSKSRSVSRQQLVKTALIAVVALASLVLLMLGILYFLPILNISKTLARWKHFLVFSDRNYLQISIQFLKALLYASPLFLVPLLFVNRKNFEKLRLFIIFLVLGLIFYLVLFDFSSGALDRYLQFIVVPLSIIGGVVAADIFSSDPIRVGRKVFVLSGLAAMGIFLTQFLPHFVPSLYPKTEWFSRVLNLKWNFLFPFTGGSGPMGFYVSWLFMAFIWLMTAVLAVLALKKINLRKHLWVAILILGFLYNGVFIEEYLFGKINGNPAVLLKNAMEFIKNDGNIGKVITYNNIGRGALKQMGKFERRLYVAPKFESSYTDILRSFKGHYLVIDIPRIHLSSPYTKYFSSCVVIYEENSKKISAKIYDCKNASEI
ncbi:MAG: glycosyltransferase family 39 protein [Candidatus Yanofskybacteria bacterium]|nr:glycosyltransferase family 39 protein [Candidatus Yanofskybacteria bacterium]